MNVSYAPRALRDLEAIAGYLTERSPSGALNVLAAINLASRLWRHFQKSVQPSMMPGIAACRFFAIPMRSSTE